jgi:hypothetical protein
MGAPGTPRVPAPSGCSAQHLDVHEALSLVKGATKMKKARMEMPASQCHGGDQDVGSDCTGSDHPGGTFIENLQSTSLY